MYLCPICRQKIKQNGNAYYCAHDNLHFPRYEKNGIEMVVFNREMMQSHLCHCLIDGDKECVIDMEDVICKTTPDAQLKSTSRHTKYLKKFSGKGKNILDIGCREGETAHWLGCDNNIIGLDVCPRFVVQAFNNKHIKYNKLAVSDGITLPFEDNTFDIVVALEVIEHTLATRKFISEIHRVLKNKGQLLISCPNLVSLWNRISIFFGSGAGISPAKYLVSKGKSSIFDNAVAVRYPDQYYHLRFFTPKSLTEFLQDQGFKKTFLFGSDPILSNLGLGRMLTNWCESIWGNFEKINEKLA